jgi:TetR/AcrR family transcriptional regulator, transcriptional repressor for nem operon
MANKTETRRSRNGVNRSVVLRKVIEVLSSKGFAKTSIADLTSATGLGYAALHRAFGSREEILRAAIRFCAETEARLAEESLRVSPTGREAILSMLEENVRLRRHWPRCSGCLFALNAFLVPPEDLDLQVFLTDRRRSLSQQIRTRIAQSVKEGELPAGIHSDTLANLCLTILSGLHSRVLDGTPPALLFRSIEMFVDVLGLRTRKNRARPRVARPLTPRRARNR